MPQYLFVYDRHTRSFPVRYRVGDAEDGIPDLPEHRVEAVRQELEEAHPPFRYQVVEMEAESWHVLQARYPELHFG